MESVPWSGGVSPAEVTIREIVLDAANWKNSDDVYDAFFEAVGACSVLARAKFQRVEGQYRGWRYQSDRSSVQACTSKFRSGRTRARTMAGDVIDLIRELAENGTPVEVVLPRSI